MSGRGRSKGPRAQVRIPRPQFEVFEALASLYALEGAGEIQACVNAVALGQPLPDYVRPSPRAALPGMDTLLLEEIRNLVARNAVLRLVVQRLDDRAAGHPTLALAG